MRGPIEGNLDAVLLEAPVEALALPALTDSRRQSLRERVLAAAVKSAHALTQTVCGPSVLWETAS